MEKTHTFFSFTKIVIAGGALKSLSSIGSIAYLEELKLVKGLKHYVGTSAGSIVCLFMVLGYSAQEIVKFLLNNLDNENIASINIDDIFNIMENYGMNLGRNLETFLSNAIYGKMKVKDATFLDLAKFTGKDLIVCVSNISSEKEEFWNVDTVPNMSIIKAVRTSCSLPILFTPVKYKDELYIDGGLYNNFPIDYFEKSFNGIKDIIGINIRSVTKKSSDNFIDYISLLFNSVINRLSKDYNNELNDNVITLQFEDEGWIHFTGLKIIVPKDVLERFVVKGYEKMKSLLLKIENEYYEKNKYDDTTSTE
jgi:predicted acylesterase/phospholipase RssA